MKQRPRSQKARVREPVQVYLDERDRALLEALAKRASLSRADVIRLGLRRLSAELLKESRPGASVEALIGALDVAKKVPRDLAARHDEYLYDRPARGATRKPRARR
jgi:hypothetical protein